MPPWMTAKCSSSTTCMAPTWPTFSYKRPTRATQVAWHGCSMTPCTAPNDPISSRCGAFGTSLATSASGPTKKPSNLRVRCEIERLRDRRVATERVGELLRAGDRRCREMPCLPAEGMRQRRGRLVRVDAGGRPRTTAHERHERAVDGPRGADLRGHGADRPAQADGDDH